MQRGRKGVPPGPVGLRLGQKRDKLNKPYLVLEIFPGRLGLVFGIAAVITYFAAAYALYQWREIKMGDYNQIGYADVLIAPFNMANLREKQGKSQIAMGKDAFKEQDWRVAYQNLQNGLRLYPSDQEARLLYAFLENAHGNHEKATRLLIDGLKYGYPESKEYLTVLFKIMQQSQNLPDLERAAAMLLTLPEIQEHPIRKYGVLKNLLRVQLLNKQFLEALDTAEQINTDPDSPYHAHDAIALALTKLGRGDEALEYIESLEENTRNHPQFLILKADACRSLDQRDKSIDILKSVFRLHPHAASPQQYAILMMLIEGDERNADLFLELYLNLNARQPAALTELATKLTDLPDSGMVKRIYDYTLANQMRNALTMEFLLAQAYLTEGQWGLAREVYDTWTAKLPENYDNENVDYFGYILDAVHDPGTATHDILVNSLEGGTLSPELYWEGIEAMRKIGSYDTAIRINDLAVERYPYNTILSDFRKQLHREQAEALDDRDRVLRKKTTGYRTDDILPMMPQDGGEMEF